jgi:hypothetical protein
MGIASIRSKHFPRRRKRLHSESFHIGLGGRREKPVRQHLIRRVSRYAVMTQPLLCSVAHPNIPYATTVSHNFFFFFPLLVRDIRFCTRSRRAFRFLLTSTVVALTRRFHCIVPTAISSLTPVSSVKGGCFAPCSGTWGICFNEWLPKHWRREQARIQHPS